MYRSLLEAYIHEKPVNEAKLGAIIDGFIDATPDMTMPLGAFTLNRRAGAMNTVADRLMVNEVMLDKALDVIQKGVAAAGDEEEPQSRAIYVTTLGQVLYKLKKYDEAERELKRAIDIACADGDGEAVSRLGMRPLATLTAFQAKVDGQTITVTGQAAVAADETGKVTKTTLHVVLVQNMVRYTGANGVRFHNLVVRKLLGSPAGTPLQPPGTKTIVSESVNVGALGDSLDAYLQKFEQDRSKPNAEFKFQERVDHLDPKQLLIVAFVQDDQTKEILQAIFVTPAR